MDMTGFRLHQSSMGAEMRGEIRFRLKCPLDREGKSKVISKLNPKG